MFLDNFSMLSWVFSLSKGKFSPPSWLLSILEEGEVVAPQKHLYQVGVVG